MAREAEIERSEEETYEFHFVAEDISKIDFDANVIDRVRSRERLFLWARRFHRHTLDVPAYRQKLRARLVLAVILLLGVVKSKNFVAEDVVAGFDVTRDLGSPGIVV